MEKKFIPVDIGPIDRRNHGSHNTYILQRDDDLHPFDWNIRNDRSYQILQRRIENGIQR